MTPTTMFQRLSLSLECCILTVSACMCYVFLRQGFRLIILLPLSSGARITSMYHHGSKCLSACLYVLSDYLFHLKSISLSVYNPHLSVILQIYYLPIYYLCVMTYHPSTYLTYLLYTYLSACLSLCILPVYPSDHHLSLLLSFTVIPG